VRLKSDPRNFRWTSKQTVQHNALKQPIPCIIPYTQTQQANGLKIMSEVLLFVRFPPSSQRSPNDLQIQLLLQRPKNNVQPQSARSSGEFSRSDVSLSTSFARVAETSVEGVVGASTKEENHSLGRSPSVRSNRSASSAGGSTSSGFTRRTSPLYNLTFHKLSSTTVTDAVGPCVYIGFWQMLILDLASGH